MKSSKQQNVKEIADEGFSLKASNCVFLVHEIGKIGFYINKVGMTPLSLKVKDVLNLKPPKTLGKSRSFVGSINHLHRFLPSAQIFVSSSRKAWLKVTK